MGNHEGYPYPNFNDKKYIMNKILTFFLSLAMIVIAADTAQAGNPDRQGEAGAYELLMNPWARSSGLHTLNTGMISGVEAMRLNVAGLSRAVGTEIIASNAIYLQGTDITMNAFGFSSSIGNGSTIGVSLMALDFGEIRETTTNQPEGTGATFSPSFFNIGIGYSHIFENKVSVGIAFRGVSERIANAAASTFAIDAGVQYVTGDNDNFKFGISLRNIGAPMRFELATRAYLPSPSDATQSTPNPQCPSSNELKAWSGSHQISQACSSM